MSLNYSWSPNHLERSSDSTDLSVIAAVGGDFASLPPYHDEPKLFCISASFPGKDISADQGTCGVSWSYEIAARKVVGETIERFSARSSGAAEFRMATFDELDSPGLDPESFRFYSCPVHPSRSHRVAWVSGQRLDGNGAVDGLVPAQLVFLPHIRRDDEPIWFDGTSNGLAAGLCVEHAIWNGIMELIERDALFAFWYRDLPLVEIDPKGIELDDDSIISLQETLRYRLIPEFYLLPTLVEGCYSVMCLLRDSSGVGPKTTLGLKTSPSLRKAVLGSLEEAHQLRYLLRELMEAEEETPAVIRTIRDRALWWFTGEAEELLARKMLNVIRDEHSLISHEGGNEDLTLGGLIHALRASGHETWVVQLPQVVESHVTMRVIISTLQAPYFDETRESLLQVNASHGRPVIRHPLM